MSEKTKGYCAYCLKPYASSYISRHLHSCSERKKRMEEEEGENLPVFGLFVTDKTDHSYWLALEMPEYKTLADLDTFLQKNWLENEVLLPSSFMMEDSQEILESSPESSPQAKDVLQQSSMLEYHIEGSQPVDLLVRVFEIEMGKDHDLLVLSRNEPIQYKCQRCGKNKAIYTVLDSNGKPMLICEQCAKRYGYTREDLKPIGNHPGTFFPKGTARSSFGIYKK